MRLLTFFFCFIASLPFSIGQNNSLLWEISGNGLKQSSYVYGTIHIIGKDDFIITDLTKNTLKKSSRFVTEIDMNIPILEQLKMINRMYLPEEKTLENYLSKKDFALLKVIITDSLNIRASKFDKYIRFKPFFLSTIISTEILGKVKSYENELHKLSKKFGLESGGLESLDFQFSLIDEIPLEKQCKGLMSEVKDFRQSLAMMNKMTAAYKNQDLDALYELIGNETSADAAFSLTFIDKRNNNWIPVMQEMMQQEACFFAVGAAHLPGKQGVLELLRSHGYTVTTLK